MSSKLSIKVIRELIKESIKVISILDFYLIYNSSKFRDKIVYRGIIISSEVLILL